MTKIQNIKLKTSRIFAGDKNPAGLRSNRGFTLTPVLAKLFRYGETACFAHHKNRCRGFTLLYSVLISSLLLSMGLAIFNIIIKELIISSTIRDSQIAFSAADAGAECALFWDLKYPGLDNGAFGGPSLGELTEGLVGHWKLDDGTGSSTAEDASGNGNDGTLTNMDPNNDWTVGEVGGALDFDGIDDYVSTTQNIGSGQVMTVAFWVNPSGVTGSGDPYVSRWKNDTNDRGFQIRQEGVSSAIAFYYSSDGATYGGLAVTDFFTPDVWQHVVVTFDNGYVEIYKDSFLLGSKTDTVTSLYDAQTPLAFGRAMNGGSWWYGHAGLDDVRIYNRVLSQGEIGDLYTLSATETFDGQVSSGSGINCNEVDISSSWDTTGTDVNGEPPRTQTVFNIDYSNGTCSTVTVIKEESDTQIESRGYNSCDLNNPRRVERGLRVTY